MGIRACRYRSRGSKVVLGGLHVLSPRRVCAIRDALAEGDGAQRSAHPGGRGGGLSAVETQQAMSDYRQDPAPRRSLLPRRSFLTTTSLIATCAVTTGAGFAIWPRMARVCRIECAIPGRSRGVRRGRAALRCFTDNNLGSNRVPTNAAGAATAEQDLPRLFPQMSPDAGGSSMALAGCIGVFVGFESLTDENLTPMHGRRRRRPATMRAGSDAAITASGEWVVRPGFDHDRTTFSPGQPADRGEPGMRHVSHSSYRQRRCSGKRGGGCCIAIGRCTTRRMRCSGPDTSPGELEKSYA
jgi:hypothetical protein